MSILVIDVGTSSIRGVLYDEKGTEIFCHQIPYQVHFIDGTHAEQEASDWSDNIVEIGRAAAVYCEKENAKIGGLALTSQRSSVIPVDKGGHALMPAIMWQDKRNKEIVDEFRGMEKAIYKLTGARINTVFSGTKMTWVRRNAPEIYEKTHKFCNIADFITHENTGLITPTAAAVF